MKIKRSLFLMLTSLILISGCVESKMPAKNNQLSGYSVATFAGGCFWCVESDFEKVSGVYEVISGFSGGHVDNPTYKQASMGTTGHVEAVQVYYAASEVSYEDLLQVFWRQIDPTDNEGQFVDRGKHYRPVIFYTSDEQLKQANKSKQNLQTSGRYDKPINIEIVAFKNFFPAEDYHQDYYKKSPLRYKYYRNNSGRDQYLSRVWGGDLKYTLSSDRKYSKPGAEILQKKLTSLQYRVTQNEATEQAFNNLYWDEKRNGIYVDIVSGEPLFASNDKFKSGTGWPSFTQPINAKYIVEETDYLLVYPRTEIRSKFADSHLGHLFKDGPEPTGLRYCINSASLRFVPVEQLKAEGYEEYLSLFSENPQK